MRRLDAAPGVASPVSDGWRSVECADRGAFERNINGAAGMDILSDGGRDREISKMQQSTNHGSDSPVVSETAVSKRLSPIAACPGAALGASVVRWPMKNPSGPLQFWRLTRKLELQRGHGRLLIHGNGYWK